MKKFLSSLIDLGVKPHNTIEQSREIRLINIAFWASTVNVLIGALNYLPHGLYSVVYTFVAYQALMTVILGANVMGINRYSKFFIVIGMNVTETINSYILPLETLNGNFCYAVAVVPFLLFKRSEWKQLLFSTLLTAFCYVLICLNIPSLSFLRTSILKPEVVETMMKSNSFFTILTVIFIVYGFYRALNIANDSISEQGAKNKAIIDNINQGIVTVDQHLIALDDHSPYLVKVLEENEITGKSLRDIIFSRSNITPDQKARIESTILSVIDSPPLSFLANRGNLPREIIFNATSGPKILEIDWQPIVNKDDLVQKMLVIIRDVTSDRHMEKESIEKTLKVEVLDQILRSGSGKIINILESSYEFVHRNRDLINSQRYSDDVLKSIFRNIHTAKGNVRTFNFTRASDVFHDAEKYCAELLANFPCEVDKNRLESDLNRIQECLDLYRNVINQKLGNSTFIDEIKRSRLELIEKKLDLATSLPDQEKEHVFTELMNLVRTKDYFTLEEILKEEISAIGSVAQEYKRAIPVVEIIDSGVRFHADQRTILRNVFIHLSRNAVAHGIEEIEERRQLKKSDAGKITLRVSQNDPMIATIYVTDDGRGLNIAKLSQIGRSKNILNVQSSDEQIAEMIFVAGVSTAEKVTDISGRGVGMDAIRSFLRDQSGDIKVIFTGPKSEKGYRPFNFVIRLPTSLKKPEVSLTA